MAKTITDELSGEQIYGLILGDKFTWVWWMNATIPGPGAGLLRLQLEDRQVRVQLPTASSRPCSSWST